VSELDLVRRRMAAQRLTGGGHASAADVVRSLGAVQAQEFAEAKWSIAERMAGEPTEDEIDAAFDRGEFVRVHVLRPTWHFVAPEDLRWMQALTAPRVHAANRPYYRQQGLDEAALNRGAEIVATALADGPLTRKEVREALASAGMELEPMAAGYVLHYAELEALICSGPRRGKQHTYALVSDRVPATPQWDEEEALAELTRRYLAGHGPATPRDFAWWSGLTVTTARQGMDVFADELQTEAGPGAETLYSAGAPPVPPERSGGHLIPMYDELGVAFKGVRMVYAKPPPEGAMARPILVDGLTVGSWRRTLERGEATIEATLFTDLDADAERALGEVAERFGRFLGLPVRLVTARA
jgi:hypothetical protein